MSSIHDQEKSPELIKDPEVVSSENSIAKYDDVSDIDIETQVQQLADELGVDEKKLMWKIDLCVVPLFVYYISFHFWIELTSPMLIFMDYQQI